MVTIGFKVKSGARAKVRVEMFKYSLSLNIATSGPTVHQCTTNARKLYQQWAVHRIR